MTVFWNLLKSIRPLQWLKNLVLFAPLVFSGLLFYKPENEIAYFWLVMYAVIVFCFLTSSIYLINDVVDKKSDNKHPFKKNRPIAAGIISTKMALIMAAIFLIVAIIFSLPLEPLFTWLIITYFLLQIAYSFWLKAIPIFDVMSIAFSFLIRIYAGAAVVNLHMNAWFLLTIISASLFLAVGKRQGELTLLGGENSGATRKTLQHYSQALLDQYTGMFASATWLTYALFAFQYQFIRDNDKLTGIFEDLPQLLQPEKVLMFTVPIAIFGVMRYLQIIYEKKEGESPALVLFHDQMLLGTVIVFGLMVIGIIYAGEILTWLS